MTNDQTWQLLLLVISAAGSALVAVVIFILRSQHSTEARHRDQVDREHERRHTELQKSIEQRHGELRDRVEHGFASTTTELRRIGARLESFEGEMRAELKALHARDAEIARELEQRLVPLEVSAGVRPGATARLSDRGDRGGVGGMKGSH